MLLAPTTPRLLATIPRLNHQVGGSSCEESKRARTPLLQPSHGDGRRRRRRRAKGSRPHLPLARAGGARRQAGTGSTRVPAAPRDCGAESHAKTPNFAAGGRAVGTQITLMAGRAGRAASLPLHKGSGAAAPFSVHSKRTADLATARDA